MKKITKLLILISIFLMLVMPALSFAATDNSLVPCGVTDQDVLASHPDYGKPCDFIALMSLVNKVITFMLVDLALPIAAIMFAYAGLMMIMAGGEAAQARTRAKSIFTYAVLGLVLAFACWLIISLVLTIMGYDGTWIGLKFGI